MNDTKLCSKCKTEKPLEEMASRGTSKKTGLQLRKSICKKCQNRMREESRKVNKTEARAASNKRRQDRFKMNHGDRRRDEKLMGTYGITLEDYNNMLASQNNRCLICGDIRYKLHVDHNHETGKVRGLLCNSCNTGIGLLKENENILLSAIEYLKIVGK